VSRVAKNPIQIPQGVQVTINGQAIIVKGPKGQLTRSLHPLIEVKQENNVLQIVKKSAEGLPRSLLARKDAVDALSGTSRALVNNMVIGVTKGFSKKLLLVGVGYRAQVQGKNLGLTLGFSHPVNYELPEGIQVKVPVQTEIEIEGSDKQLVGQVASEIRAFRPPEPYKGKGVRYSDEVVILKETKKK
jgi:large subunit ribosomal protein L6